MIKNFGTLVLCVVGLILCIRCSTTSESKREQIEDHPVLKKEFESESNSYVQVEKEEWIPYKDRKVKGASGTEIVRCDGKLRQIFTAISKKMLENKKARDQLFSDLITVYKIGKGESILLFASIKAAKDAYLHDMHDGRTWKSDYLGYYRVGDDYFFKFPGIKEKEIKVEVELSAEAKLQLTSQ